MKTQKKYRSLNRYYIRTGINRMLKLYNQATPEEKKAGAQWYAEAHKYAAALAIEHNTTTETAAKIISILSPSVEWQLNKQQAAAMIEAHNTGSDPAKVIVSTYDGNKYKAIATLKDKPIQYKPREIKNGEYTGKTGKPRTARPGINRETALKTYAFFQNINQGENAAKHVTIDRHHLTAFFKSPKIMTKEHKTIKSLTAARYADISTATKTAAASVGLKPYQFQAIVWDQVRKKQAPKQERQKITV